MPEEAPLGRSIAGHLRHHARFYCGALTGLGFYLLAAPLAPSLRLIAAGDLFFCVYLAAVAIFVLRTRPEDLRARAADEDEGIAIVVLIVLTAIGFSCAAIVAILNERQAPAILPLVLAIAGAPLGWLTLHTIAALHYANLFYGPRSAGAGPALGFPGTAEPGVWDFIYFAFVVGMTAQVSDVTVLSTMMRRATLGHSLVSFAFNTAIIAMAVNALVAVAG